MGCGQHAVPHDFLYEGMLALASTHLAALQLTNIPDLWRWLCFRLKDWECGSQLWSNGIDASQQWKQDMSLSITDPVLLVFFSSPTLQADGTLNARL
jgi:hypothetical protein